MFPVAWRMIWLQSGGQSMLVFERFPISCDQKLHIHPLEPANTYVISDAIAMQEKNVYNSYLTVAYRRS